MNTFDFKYYCSFSVPLDAEDDDAQAAEIAYIEDHIQNAIYKALDELGGEVTDIEVK